MAKQKYYVVWHGLEPGIYDNWPEAQAQVTGFKNARYKSYPTLEDAAEAYAEVPPGIQAGTTSETAQKKARQKAAPVPSTNPPGKPKPAHQIRPQPMQHNKSPAAPEPATIIYCDGAADPNPGPSGTGIAIYRNGCLTELHYGLYKARGTNNTAELNGILHALKIAEPLCQAGERVRIASDSAYGINAITDWAYKWKANGWKRGKAAVKNVELVQETHALYDRLKDTIEVVHVKAHSGIEGNELADRMAMLAITRKQASLVIYDEPLDVSAILALRAG